jgi:hypothetical protein
MIRASRLDSKRGVSADRHDTWGAGCGGRFGDARDSVVRTNGADADAKACGPGLQTLRPSRAVTSRAMTGAIKPGPRGERAISVKTIAQGMPDDLAEPVVTAASFFYLLAGHGLRPAPGIPCALLFGGRFAQQLGRNSRRENANSYSLCCLTFKSESRRLRGRRDDETCASIDRPALHGSCSPSVLRTAAPLPLSRRYSARGLVVR